MFDSVRPRSRRIAGLAEAPVRRHQHHPDFNTREMRGWKALEAVEKLPLDGWRKEQQWALDMGLPGADSIVQLLGVPFEAGFSDWRRSSGWPCRAGYIRWA